MEARSASPASLLGGQRPLGRYQRLQHEPAGGRHPEPVGAQGVEDGGKAGRGHAPIDAAAASADHPKARRALRACHGQPSSPCANATRNCAPPLVPLPGGERRKPGVRAPQRVDRAEPQRPARPAQAGPRIAGAGERPAQRVGRADAGRVAHARRASVTARRGSPWSASKTASSVSTSTPASRCSFSSTRDQRERLPPARPRRRRPVRPRRARSRTRAAAAVRRRVAAARTPPRAARGPPAPRRSPAPAASARSKARRAAASRRAGAPARPAAR